MAVRKSTKKTASKVTSSVFVEYNDEQYNVADIAKKAENAYREEHKGASIKELKVYVQPEANVAYYTIDGEGGDDYKVSLDD